MKKLIFILCVFTCIFGSYMILKAANTNTIKEYLDYKYPNETFSVKSVSIDMKRMEIIAHISDSYGIESTIRKKGSDIYSDYELVKSSGLIENELKEVLRKSELIDHISNIDVKILERIEYSEISNGFNPSIYLTIIYNRKFSDKKDFAQMCYDVVSNISKSKYNNIGTYVFLQSTEYDAMNLVINKEDSESDLDTLVEKVEIVKENKAD